jgi:hypothetical protein
MIDASNINAVSIQETFHRGETPLVGQQETEQGGTR